MYDWPNGHTFKHLKRQVVVDLVDKCDMYADKLETHLKKTKLSYQEAVEEIRQQDDEEPIPSNLSDLVIAAISLVIKQPIIVIKPVIECVKDRNNIVKTVYNTEVEYLFKQDRKKGAI